MCLCISLCNLLYPSNSILYFSSLFFFIKCMLMLMNASFLKTMWEPLFLPRFAFSFCFLVVVNFPEVLPDSANDKDSSPFSDTAGSCGVSLQANGIFYLCPFSFWIRLIGYFTFQALIFWRHPLFQRFACLRALVINSFRKKKSYPHEGNLLRSFLRILQNIFHNILF